MVTEQLKAVSLRSIVETSKHVYEGTAAAETGTGHYVLPFYFSDLDGRLILRESESSVSMPLRLKKEAAAITEDLLLDRIVDLDF